MRSQGQSLPTQSQECPGLASNQQYMSAQVLLSIRTLSHQQEPQEARDSQAFGANVIVESFYVQVDGEGQEFAIMGEIFEHV